VSASFNGLDLTKTVERERLMSAGRAGLGLRIDDEQALSAEPRSGGVSVRAIRSAGRKTSAAVRAVEGYPLTTLATDPSLKWRRAAASTADHSLRRNMCLLVSGNGINYPDDNS
jgi:hypothetical protein